MYPHFNRAYVVSSGFGCTHLYICCTYFINVMWIFKLTQMQIGNQDARSNEIVRALGWLAFAAISGSG